MPCHQDRKSLLVTLAIVAAAFGFAVAIGINPAYVLILAVCPLMMLVVMRSGHGHGEQASHRADQDITERPGTDELARAADKRSSR